MYSSFVQFTFTYRYVALLLSVLYNKKDPLWIHIYKTNLHFQQISLSIQFNLLEIMYTAETPCRGAVKSPLNPSWFFIKTTSSFSACVCVSVINVTIRSDVSCGGCVVTTTLHCTSHSIINNLLWRQKKCWYFVLVGWLIWCTKILFLTSYETNVLNRFREEQSPKS